MQNKSKVIAIAAATFLSITAAAVAAETTQPMEKCYGISKAEMNDCATAAASCAGSATKDRQADAFIFLPKGTCNRIVGGVLKPVNKKE